MAGGTGQIGQHLASHWRSAGHQVVTLTRRPPRSDDEQTWDGRTLGDWASAVDGADVVVNLAGRSVNCRYNTRNRLAIYFSRLDATRAMGLAIAHAAAPPRLWLNASTATIYRHALDRGQDEASGEVWRGDEPGVPDKWHFSVDVARRWEQALADALTPHTRKLALRAAMVMDPAPSGVFAVLSKLVRLRLGGRNGSGRQYVSWIHVADLLRAIDFLVEREDLAGAVNVCSPKPLPNAEFMHVLRQAWKVSIGLPAAAWMLEIGALLLGTETELLLKSRRVVPGRLSAAGFAFTFPDWQRAATDLVAQMRPTRP
jgi:uncharacterized protein (TIGR01777 family)